MKKKIERIALLELGRGGFDRFQVSKVELEKRGLLATRRNLQFLDSSLGFLRAPTGDVYFGVVFEANARGLLA